MKLQPVTCPKCGDEMWPVGSPCQLCALRRHHNRIFAGVVGLAMLAVVAFVSLRPTAPPQRATLLAPMPAALPAPTAPPVVIQDAPFTYSADAPQFTDSQPQVVPAPRVLAPTARRQSRRASVPQWQRGADKALADEKAFDAEIAANKRSQSAELPVSRYQQMHQMIREIDQQIDATNDIDHLERIAVNLRVLTQDTTDAVNEGVMRRDGDGIQFAQNTSINLENLIAKCQIKILRLRYPDSGQLRAQTQAAQAENDAMALNR